MVMSLRRCCMLVAATLLSLSSWADEQFAGQLQQAVVAADYQRLQSLHEQLGPDGDEQVYLWAYSGWRLAQRMPESESKRRKKLLKALQRTLEGYLDSNPGDAESMALLGSVLGDRISGPLSAMRLGGKAGEMLEAAYALAGDNPRVALQRGVGYFFTPKAFGGGAEKAEAELRRALQLFDAGPEEQWPNWGHLDTLARLGEVLAELGRPEEARQLYDRALAMEPDYVWVRDELLPALERDG